MSVFYDLASLVLVPSGYKSGKVYSQKPLTTDGQLAFTRASTATRVNASGLIESIATGVPRLDYLGSTCPKLLLEPQRSNAQIQSEDFSQANWDKSSVSITTNTAASPAGNTTADTLTASAGNSSHFLYDDFVSFSSGANTMSVFVKYNTNRWVALQWFDGAAAFEASFDIQNGVKGLVDASASSSITSFGSGWYRISLTATSASGGTGYFALGLNNSDTATLQTWTATGSESVYIWGAQMEAGAYATSYIPTTTAAVTRVADDASKTGISSLIGQTEGAFMIDVNLDLRAQFTYFTLSPNLAVGTNYLGILIGNASIAFESVVSSVLEAGITLSNSSTGRFKIAVAYKANDFVMYVNGTQVGTDTSGTFAACSEMGLYEFAQVASLKYNQALLFKTRLTNAQLAELTSL
jgi:hypothetical protein